MRQRSANAMTGAAALALTALAGWSGCRSSQDPERLFAEAETLQQAYTSEGSHQAIATYREAADLWMRRGQPASAARAVHGIGTTYERLGALEDSLDSHLEALTISEQSDDRLLESRIRSDVGMAHARLGQVDDGLRQCRLALDLARRAGGIREQGQALNCLGEVDYHRGRSREALDYYRQAEPLFDSLGDRRGRAETLLLLGSAYVDLNEFDTAGRYLNDALSLWTALGDERGQALTRLALSRLQFFPGKYQEALTQITSVRDRFATAADAVWEAAVLSNMAYIYEEMGEARNALGYWEDAAARFEEAGLQMAALEMSIRIGTRHLESDASSALAWFEKARALSEAAGNPHMLSWALRYIGVVHLARGDPTEALRHLQHSLEVQREVEDPWFRRRTLADIGRAHQALGDRARAVQYFEQALELSQAAGDRVAETTALFDLARVWAASDDLDAARRCVEAALDIAESLRTEVESQELRASYFASIHRYHELHVDVLMRLHEHRPRAGLAAEAFAASERARARSLLESLADARVDLRAGIDPTLLGREQTLHQAFEDWGRRQRDVVGGPNEEADANDLAEEYRDLEERYRQVQAEIRSQSPRYAALTQPQPLRLDQVQKQVLDTATILLEYALGEERSFLWAVSSEGYTSHELPAREEIETAARRVIESLTARLSTSADRQEWRQRIADADAQYWDDAARLSEMLLGPVAQDLPGKRILVVADGALQYVPFAALPLPGPSSEPVPLIVDHEIVNLPSASTLAVLRRETRDRRTPDRAVAVLADPVFEPDDPRLRARLRAATGATDERPRPLAPGPALGLNLSRLSATRQEADAIVRAAPDGMAFKAIDFGASRATALSPELGRYRIVHFATHGVFDNENPGLSGVVLSMFDQRGEPQDGFLRLRDIYSLQLPVDLVVLSACSTALGKQVRGEGLVGIVRGFMYAGAKRVVASLWKVDDEATGALMGSFYQEMLKEGRSPAAALRQAQLTMWQHDRWKAPFYWAAFTLQGEWR